MSQEATQKIGVEHHLHFAIVTSTSCDSSGVHAEVHRENPITQPTKQEKKVSKEGGGVTVENTKSTLFPEAGQTSTS